MMIILAIANVFLRPYVIFCLWTWSAVQILGWRAFGYWQIFLFTALVSEIMPSSSAKKTTEEEDRYAIFMDTTRLLFALSLGWVAHWLA